jgi:acyl carrier protein
VRSFDDSFVEREVYRILEKVFALPSGTLSHDISSLGQFDWDSLKHIQVILELEDAFDLDLSDLDGRQLWDIDSVFGVLKNILS